LVVARFRNVPQDDEYLQVLEAVGFMTLLWKSVPAEIERVLQGANPMQETHASLTKLVAEAISEAIPSQQDLRGIAQSLREHETALRSMTRPPSNRSRVAPTPLSLVLIGAAILAIAYFFLA
jgi:hypothetical protein